MYLIYLLFGAMVGSIEGRQRITLPYLMLHMCQIGMLSFPYRACIEYAQCNVLSSICTITMVGAEEVLNIIL